MKKSQQHTKCLICDSKSLNRLNDFEQAFLVKCGNCSFVFTEKIPSQKELTTFYNEEYESTRYLSPITVKRYEDILDQLEKYRSTNRLLDVGAGKGYFLEVAKSKGWDVYGTELTDAAIEVCSKKGFTMSKGKLEDISYGDNIFDVIIGIEIIEHLNNPHQLVSEMKRVLRPGGYIYLTTPNFNAIHRYRLKSDYNIIDYPLHLCYYTPKTLKILFQQHAFKVDFIRTTGYSITRLKTSKGESNQAFVSETSNDEMLRYKIEKKPFLKLVKYLINGMLNLFNIGDSLKGGFIK